MEIFDQEKKENDNLIYLEGTGKELLEKIIDNVEKKYKSEDTKTKNIYSFLGYNILISINTYTDINKIKNLFYSKDIKKIYEEYFNNISKGIKINPPKAHIYYLIEDAYRNMLKPNSRNQVFIITGDSGSGKTENAKIILEYLTSSNNDEISKNIMDSNPLLEAFGNAKTIRNDNSSEL